MRIILLLLLAMLAAANVSHAQEPFTGDAGRQACDAKETLVPLANGERGLGVWRNPRTGDVLIRGNLFGTRGDVTPEDVPACGPRGERQARERRR